MSSFFLNIASLRIFESCKLCRYSVDAFALPREASGISLGSSSVLPVNQLLPEVVKTAGRKKKLQGHIYDDVPDSCQLEILNQEVCFLHSAAVWHVLSFCSVSRLGEQPLQGVE
jgi:hypothetical protein